MSETTSTRHEADMSDTVGAILATLVEMGFEEARAKKALEQTGWQGVEAAMEWLLAHPEGVIQSALTTRPVEKMRSSLFQATTTMTTADRPLPRRSPPRN